MPTIALTVAYNGAPFHGFARQPGQLTVQGSLEEALFMVYARPVETVCAGRTDSGVHALGQQVSFDVDGDELDAHPLRTLARSLNALSHEGISVRDARLERDGFSARFDAQAREYRYRICTASAPPVFMADFCWHFPFELDLDAMQRATNCLIGEHDFKSFCFTASAEGKPTCRNLMQVDVHPVQICGEDLVEITVVGDSFLHSMVRTLVGTLVLIGRKKRSVEWMEEVLNARNRSAAGENAPAVGLTFWSVRYD